MTERKTTYEPVGIGVVQAVARGDQYRRIIGVLPNGMPLYAGRRTGHFVVFDYETGDMEFIAAKGAPSHIVPSDFCDVSYKEEGGIDNTRVEGPSASTVRKDGTSYSYHKLPEEGDPNYKIRKPDNSFKLRMHPSKAGRKRK